MKINNEIEVIYLYDVSNPTGAAGNGVNNNTMECSFYYPVVIKRIIASCRMNASYGLPSVFTMVLSGGGVGDISYMTTGKGFESVRYLIYSSTTMNMDIKLKKGIYVPGYDEDTSSGLISIISGIRCQNTIPIGEQITTNIIIEGIKL
jgi:hypothetical protein